MHRLIDFSLRNRFLILAFTLLAAGFGVYSMFQLPIDAVPDVTPNQVAVLTQTPGLGPVEVEQFVTFPVETAMSGLPGITKIRSVSRFGLSSVYIYFEESIDLYFARRLVMERLPEARELIPEGYGTPSMGPISTGLGEIYQFEVRGEGYTPMELRSILDWEIGFKLQSVPGVVEVNSYGGELKTYEIQLDPNRLVAHNVSLDMVFDALRENNANAGGAYIERSQEQYVIRGEGLITSLEDIDNIVVTAVEDGTPIFIRNIGRAAFAPMVRQGAVTRDGRGEVVTGVVMMLMGENPRVIARNVDEELARIKPTLPPGVEIDTFYDRTDLVRRTIATVQQNLVEGGLLVIAVLLLFLGNLRGGLIVASVIPLSMLFAFTGMVQAGLSGNLMSLGAIDFGLIVDGSVVMVENIVRRLSQARNGQIRDEVVGWAGREVARPVFFAVMIIIIVYLPIMVLQGIEGKMFRPMALTVVFALVASLVLALTLMPVLSVMMFRKRIPHKTPRLVAWLLSLYRPLLDRVLSHPRLAGAGAALVFAGSLLLVPFMGTEFLPKLNEGAIAVQAWRLPSVALSESTKSTTLVEKTLLEFPEVVTVVSRTGQAEIPTDPMGVETSDIYAILTDQHNWETADTKEGLIEEINRALERRVPGNIFSYSQPIELRMQEMIAGVRSDLAVTVYGPDLDELRRIGDEVQRVVARVPGSADVKAEQTSGLPFLRVRIDRGAVARYGINVADVLAVVETMGGTTLGEVLEGQARFPLRARFVDDARKNIEQIRSIRVSGPEGAMIPLSQLAEIWTEEGPAQISREQIQRRITVEANVRGRDLGGFAADVQAAVAEGIDLPPGYSVEYGGQFENMERATKRLALVVPIALFLIFLLLYTAFKAVKPAILIYFNIPLAATGGILALFLRGMPLSISAGVGFIALFGVAVLNGVVMVSYFLDLRKQGMTVDEAVRQGAERRMRPVLMTALVASLGFVPMALSTSAGAEVQSPLATVVIGGLVTSTLLTLFVLPSLYRWLERDDEA
ncbi:MAG: CusA/CzcA family heavy metal efflux RND transporter [Gammaproteobacteria bacterium]|nr:CusA/CzcA family heavy metal efflux RND transporter [Gammaproteobacteria bacterium]